MKLESIILESKKDSIKTTKKRQRIIMYNEKLREAELVAKVAEDYFNLKHLDTTKYIGNIDFCVSYDKGHDVYTINFLWAEAKRGVKEDIIESFIQLILTIGKEKTYSDELPPAFLGALDCEKIAFIEYHEIQEIFSQNDFNWNVTLAKMPHLTIDKKHTKSFGIYTRGRR